MGTETKCDGTITDRQPIRFRSRSTQQSMLSRGVWLLRKRRTCGRLLTNHSSRRAFGTRLNSGVRPQGDCAVRWSYIFKLAAAILVVQFSVGFLDGLLAPAGAGVAWLVGSHAASLALCGTAFAIFASRQPFRPFTHAWIALLVHLLAGFAFSRAVEAWLGSTSLASTLVGILIVTCALLGGTSLGIHVRHQAGQPADA